MSSRWQANKVGLINFWYYDEQEFIFSKGRMLLRGSNGSGKSVTMQSIIPLLLDGNMSPERLDPFGSRDRKMNSYILEEEDERDERTGYLYLECKREESNTYLTIGMGMRARKGKPLDQWYFALSDGRRIGEDFLLYKEMGEKITLSKKELSNRIGMGGQVFERQVEYMEYVNRQIFGFDTMEEYKEMIDLLIQLRTPKLSKDFKPTVISEILSNSLQPLSDEELRPMSEAIENMDTLNLNLKARQEGINAAGKINKVLERYNGLLLWEKANFYHDNMVAIDSLEKEIKELEKRKNKSLQRIVQLEEEERTLDAKKFAFEEEKELFQKSDAWNLKKQEVDLKQEISEITSTLQMKEKQLEGKKESIIELEEKEKREVEKQEIGQGKIDEILDDMQNYAEDMGFQEHDFMQADFQKEKQANYSFTTHKVQLDEWQQNIKQGSKYLKESEYLQKQIEDHLKKRDDNQREVDKTERKINELQASLTILQNDWKEALYKWNDENTLLFLTKECLQNMCNMIENYDLQTDYRLFKKFPDAEYNKRLSEIELNLQQARKIELEKKENLDELAKELAEWKNLKEPVPPRSEEVIGNRKLLEKEKIAYQEFYKVLEFSTALTKEQCNYLEEALLHMGILDALVVDINDRERIFALDSSNCDRYLFIKDGKVDESLLEVLEINEDLNDIFLKTKVVRLLNQIGFYHFEKELSNNAQDITVISPEGFYQIGAITGTITGTYEAGFLGSRARENNRLKQMEQCQANMIEIQKELEEIKGKIENYQESKRKLAEEFEAFPKEEALRSVLNEKDEYLRAQKQFKKEVEMQEYQLQVVGKEKNEVYRLAIDIAQKLYLTCTLEVFENAQEAATQYEKLYYELKALHEKYVDGIHYHEHLLEQIEKVQEDVDQILYEINKLKTSHKKAEELYLTVSKRLKVEGFEQQQVRMEECKRWLDEYPQLIKNCTKEKTNQEDLAKQLELEAAQQVLFYEKLESKNKYLQISYEKELALEYVTIPDEIEKNPKSISGYLGIESKGLSKGKELGNLNMVIFEQQNYLMDYQLMKLDLFTDLDEQRAEGYPESHRIDITARYKGVKVSFLQLLRHLEEEIEEIKLLIREGDRELFEDILANTISKKLRSKINSSNAWVEKMNGLMDSMNTSSGLKLNLKWRYKTAESEQQLDTKELVEYLKKDYRMLKEEEAEKLSMHFRSKVEEARRQAKDSGGIMSFYQVMKDTLDYRKWFEFQLFSQKTGERMKELTNSVFGTFSGGEKAMAMYVPLFSAVVAKYQGGSPDAPRLISLAEAFAGVDNKNIKDMFRLMAEFKFEFMINSQVLWGDVDTLDALSIYQLIRPTNAKFVTVMPYIWNGYKKEMIEDELQMEQRAAQFS